MKKIVIGLLCILLTLTLSACNNSATSNKYQSLINTLVTLQENSFADDDPYTHDANDHITIKGVRRSTTTSGKPNPAGECTIETQSIIITNNGVYIPYIFSSASSAFDYFLFSEIEYIQSEGKIVWKK